MEPHWSNYLRRFDFDSSYFQDIPNSTNKYCVIIEPRKHKLLVPVIKNFMYLLQKKGWGLIVCHGTENEMFIKLALQDWKGVHYININVPDLTLDKYNHLMLSSKFWQLLIDYFNCKHALIFQTDTILLKDSVDDFLEYDYVGAPWYREWIEGIRVGNGGLSLRRTDKMVSICEARQKSPVIKMNEDIFFSYMCKQLKYKVPTVEQAKRFSVETIYYPTPIGIHKPHLDKFPDPDALHRMLNQTPITI